MVESDQSEYPRRCETELERLLDQGDYNCDTGMKVRESSVKEREPTYSSSFWIGAKCISIEWETNTTVYVPHRGSTFLPGQLPARTGSHGFSSSCMPYHTQLIVQRWFARADHPTAVRNVNYEVSSLSG